MAVSLALRKWRQRLGRGAIMKPATFEKIVRDSMAEGLSEKRALKIAGRAYWNAAQKKFRARRGK